MDLKELEQNPLYEICKAMMGVVMLNLSPKDVAHDLLGAGYEPQHVTFNWTTGMYTETYFSADPNSFLAFHCPMKAKEDKDPTNPYLEGFTELRCSVMKLNPNVVIEDITDEPKTLSAN